MRARAPRSTVAGVRQQRKQQTHAALLVAARAVIKRDGFARTTTRAVAQEAGVAVGTVFVHFPDVGALAEALLDDVVGAALASAYRTLPRRGDVVDRLVHVCRKLYDSYDVDPDLSREYLKASLFEHRPDGPAAARMAGFERWVTAQIADAVAQGAMPAIEPHLAFLGFFALYFAALGMGLRGQLGRKDQLVFLDAALRRFFHTKDRT